jgi:formylglycine-generating enzyme required for sulfatase activity
MPEAKRATWGIFSTHSAAFATYGMQGFYVAGSNDGDRWTVIHGNPEFIYPSTTTYKFGRSTLTNIPVAFERPGNYRFYRFYFYCTNAVVYNLQLFETGGDRINRITSESQPSTYYIGGNLAVHAAANYAPVDPNYPKGFQAFYVMKHELTQAAWVDFLNCLSWDQQHRIVTNAVGSAPNAALNNVTPATVEGINIFQYQYPNNDYDVFANRPGIHRMNIRIRSRGIDGPAVFGIGQRVSQTIEDEEGNLVTVADWDWNHEIWGGNLPMFNLAWTDITAYLDWACLRPMTELEYEKACRGDQGRVGEEYAWGKPFLPSRAAAVEHRNTPIENPLPAVANYAQVEGGNIAAHTAVIAAYWPVRAGSFAKEETTREEAGASYWGILNLSDNVPERVINISTPLGRAYTGGHGDGNLTAIGLSNVPDWPSQNVALALNNAQALGTGYRGIAVTSTSIQIIRTVSYRGEIDAANYNQNHRDLWTGLRGVRTAPKD